MEAKDFQIAVVMVLEYTVLSNVDILCYSFIHPNIFTSLYILIFLLEQGLSEGISKLKLGETSPFEDEQFHEGKNSFCTH